MKIVVLAGGLSPERNVSLSSGGMVTTALRELGHQVALVDLFFDVTTDFITLSMTEIPDHFIKIATTVPDQAELLALRGDNRPSPIGQGIIELCRQADITYLALHGSCGEDGRLQALLDLEGIAYTGSDHISSAIAMDKDLTKRLVACKVTTPKWQSLHITEENRHQLDIPLPAVVKPLSSGSSVGVSIVKTPEELDKALQIAINLGGNTVIEEYITGREIQIAILEGRALPSIEIIIEDGFYDYENKYQPDRATEICPSVIPPEWEERIATDALTVFETIGLSVYSRADFIVTEDGTPYFLEINTLPGMTPTSLVPQEAAAIGMDYKTLCQTIIDASLKARRKG